ncbi:hypothetical protein GCM10007862_13710 [Dyella lipolytica]|uniref:DUF5343 domain-containing protein n=1 Tax=Dyella lipolytica TaxID=1867835 RepID=A0ABW8IVT3_9GAMM|nr:DUF5343 domain-containing protein [Dyella lipolytica]GLQ46320.1 hypothetical protein GCM10007862_13710 [Dyella lipolytica]
MADKHPYVSGASGLVAAVAQLRKSFPAKVTAETFKKLGIAPNNETYIVNTLRFLHIIDGEGNKIAEAASVLVQHDEIEFQKGFAGIVQDAYASLFDLHGVDAWTATSDRLISFFRSSDHTSDIVGRRQAGTFQTLATISGKLDGNLPKTSTQKTKKADSPVVKSRATKSASSSKSQVGSRASVFASENGDGGDGGGEVDGAVRGMALTVRVEINLPASADKETYDNIFKSIRENLMNGKRP